MDPSSEKAEEKRAVSHRFTGMLLLVYAVITGILSFCQAGYINADYVAYATVAHRMIDGSAPFVTGYWSPLFSWLIVPGAAMGVPDLIAGRWVLILGGAIYVAASMDFLRQSVARLGSSAPILVPAFGLCIVIQASIGATLLLTPDILASGFLMVYFGAMLRFTRTSRSDHAFVAGLAAGVAYLAKTYMLPFALLHFAVLAILFLPERDEGDSKPRRRFVARLRSAWPFPVGVFLVAGPWIAMLSHHYGRLVFSTAGSSNYANMGPGLFEKDPLWNPGLVQDYMADPYLAPTWSAIGSWAEFLHQDRVVLRNLSNGFGHVLPWMVFLLGAGAYYLFIRRKTRLDPQDRCNQNIVWWCMVTALIYYLGYWLVNNEARYIISVISPLFCLSAIILIARAGAKSDSVRTTGPLLSPQTGMMVLLALALVASCQDLYRVYRIATKHSQSGRLELTQYLAEQLRQAQLLPAPFAASQWHDGMTLGYVAQCSNLYWGTPLGNNPQDLAQALRETPVSLYLHYGDTQTNAASVPDGWQRIRVIRYPPLNTCVVEVYQRSDHSFSEPHR